MNDRLTTALERLIGLLERLAEEGSLKPPAGLLSYEQVGQRIGRGGKALSRRQVERIQKKYPRKLPKVPSGARTVGFRPADVDKLIAHLAGDERVGGRRL